MLIGQKAYNCADSVNNSVLQSGNYFLGARIIIEIEDKKQMNVRNQIVTVCGFANFGWNGALLSLIVNRLQRFRRSR